MGINLKQNKSIFFITLGISIFGILLFVLERNIRPAKSWYDVTYTYRKQIAISYSGTAKTNYDVLLNIDTASLISASKMQSDCDDIRFADNDDITALNYWIEGGCNTSSTNIWIRVPNIPDGGKNIFMYYGKASATIGETSFSGNFTMLSDSACPSGWTRNSDFDGKFFKGNSSYGVTGGSSSHSHTATSSVGYANASSGFYVSGYRRGISTHSHSGGSVSGSTTNDILPPYLDMIFCEKNKIDLTNSSILMFDTSISTGWSRFSSLDSKFPRGNSSYGGTGGSTTHSHTFTASSLNANNNGTWAYECTYGTLCNNQTIAAEGHGHSGGSGSNSVTNMPLYKEIYFYKKSASGVLGTEQPVIIVDTTSLPYGWTAFTGIDNYFPYGANGYGTTGGSATHSHSGSMNSGSQSSTTLCDDGDPGVGSLVRTHTHSISYTSNSESNNPPYIDVVMAKRNSPSNDGITLSIGGEVTNTPITPTIGTPTALSTTSIRWNFTDNSSDETGFKIYDQNGVLKVTCATPNISYCDETGLSVNTQYTRVVTAYNANGDSSYSSSATKYTLIETPVLSVSLIEPTQITLLGSGVSNLSSGNSGLYFDCNSTGCDTGINEWIKTTTDIATNLTPNSSYSFRLVARNGDGTTTSYTANSDTYTYASIPTVTFSSISSTSFELTAGNTNNLSTGQSAVYFNCTTVGCTMSNLWDTDGIESISGLTPNTQYTFKVKARNYNGVETIYSSDTPKYTYANTPNTPSVSAQSSTSVRFIINSNLNSNPATTLYAINEENTGNYVNYQTGLLQSTPSWATYTQWGSTLGVVVQGLTANDEYIFKVKAKNGDDIETAYSSTVSIYLLAPSTGCYIIEARDGNSYTIKWKDNSSTEDGYKIEKKVDSGLFTSLITLDPNTTQYIDSNVPFGYTYTYRVAPIYDGSTGSWCTTIPSAHFNGGIKLF